MISKTAKLINKFYLVLLSQLLSIYITYNSDFNIIVPAWPSMCVDALIVTLLPPFSYSPT